MYTYCIHCIHYVYRILDSSLGSLADRQAAPPISRGSSANGLDHPQPPRPFSRPFRAFGVSFTQHETTKLQERGCLASFRMSRRAALPAGAWLTFACALCTGANLTIRPASRGREALASTKWCALRHAACFVLAVTAQAHDAQQHCRTAMRIHCLASGLALPHTVSCAVLRQVDFRSDRQARHLPGSSTRFSGLLEHCKGQNISQPSNPWVPSV